MSKFDIVRKNIKRKTNKIHFLYAFLFVVLMSVGFYFLKSTKEEYEKNLSNAVNDFERKSLTIGESLLTTIKTNNEYKAYFDSLPFGKPLDSMIVNSNYGWRYHPVDSFFKFHTGIDLDAKLNTKIYASGSGKVIFSSWRSGYGKLIIIQHPFNHKSLYAHLNSFLIDSGQYISKGQIIALSGRTGKVSGPHLHYEIQLNNRVINPFEYLSKDKLYDY